MQKPLEWELPTGRQTSEISLRPARGLPFWRFSSLLNRLDKAVGGASGRKYADKPTRGEVLAVWVKLSRADMRALKRLRRVVRRRCRAGLRRSAIAAGDHTAPDSGAARGVK